MGGGGFLQRVTEAAEDGGDLGPVLGGSGRVAVSVG